MKKRLRRKKRKKIIDEHPEYGPRGFVCENCGRKMDVLNEYQWKYGFCNVNCGNELFGVGYGHTF